MSRQMWRKCLGRDMICGATALDTLCFIVHRRTANYSLSMLVVGPVIGGLWVQSQGLQSLCESGGLLGLVVRVYNIENNGK